MSPQPPPAPGSFRSLYDRARAELGRMLDQAEAQEQDERQAAARLSSRLEERLATDRRRIEQGALHRYGVFAVGGSRRRRMVLRDVAELDGRAPLHTTSDFAEALQFAGSQLDDPVLRPREPVDPGELAGLLQRLLCTLQHIETVNARLQGSGTAADPYVVGAGAALHVSGPCTLGFSQVTPGELRLTPRGRHLQAARQTSTP